ncbi:hypothetical protein OAE50_02215 [Candidatus Poseidoniaceae archaeon]|nr:hypothetical protein [Candidatus Poseidoniaceae archaeon]
MQSGIDPGKPSQTQFSGQPQYINEQIQQTQGFFPQQQIIIINAKFQPSFNFRYLSYAIFALGISASFILSNMRTDSDADQYIGFLGEASCCLSIILTFVFDAVFYKGKADWESTTGQSNTGSITGMIFDILFAVLVILFGFMWFIGD